MPHFTLQITPRGPLVQAAVGVSRSRASALTAAGQPVPLPVPIVALIDTGASCTCVDPSVLTALNLTPTGSVLINTPSSGSTPHQAEQYDVLLAIPGSPAAPHPLVLPTIAVIASELHASQAIHALIGRDILNQCLLVYNGAIGTFTLAF